MLDDELFQQSCETGQQTLTGPFYHNQSWNDPQKNCNGDIRLFCHLDRPSQHVFQNWWMAIQYDCFQRQVMEIIW